MNENLLRELRTLMTTYPLPIVLAHMNFVLESAARADVGRTGYVPPPVISLTLR